MARKRGDFGRVVVKGAYLKCFEDTLRRGNSFFVAEVVTGLLRFGRKVR